MSCDKYSCQLFLLEIRGSQIGVVENSAVLGYDSVSLGG
jgi:hypothetical protein